MAGFAGAFLVICILTFYLWHQAEMIRLGYETRKLEEKVMSLTEEIKTLEAKKAALLSLDRVEQIATEKLGLRAPGKDQVIFEDTP